jgi:hypothetical protein
MVLQSRQASTIWNWQSATSRDEAVGEFQDLEPDSAEEEIFLREVLILCLYLNSKSVLLW